MSGSASNVSRRVSEFVGVALFAASLIWIVSLASYEPSDPVWFFSTGSHAVPLNFAGRIGAFLAEVSFQLFGYASYVIPLVMVVVGWNYFWCRKVDAAATKATGATLFFACVSAFLSLVFSTLDVSGKSFRAGGYIGDFLARELSDYLNRTGSLIVVVTLIVLAVILSTQFSFGRMMASIIAATKESVGTIVTGVREWWETRRREKERAPARCLVSLDTVDRSRRRRQDSARALPAPLTTAPRVLGPNTGRARSAACWMRRSIVRTTF